MSWLKPQFMLDRRPVFPKGLNGMTDVVSLAELSDVRIAETINGHVTASSLIDIARGRALTSLTVDFIKDLIRDSDTWC